MLCTIKKRQGSILIGIVIFFWCLFLTVGCGDSSDDSCSGTIVNCHSTNGSMLTPTPSSLENTAQSKLAMATDAPPVMNYHTSYTIMISLIVKGHIVNSDLSIEKSVVTQTTITAIGTPDASLQDAFGPSLKPSVSATLVAVDAFHIVRISPEKIPLDQSKATWIWSVYPLQSGSQFLTTDIEATWGNGVLEKGPYQIAERTFEVNIVTPNVEPQAPFFMLGHLDIGAVTTALPGELLGAGGLGAMLILLLIKKSKGWQVIAKDGNKVQTLSRRKKHPH